MNDQTISQSGNVAGGDVVAGNKYDNSVKNFFADPPSTMPVLDELYRKFKDEVKSDPELRSNIDKFNYFTMPYQGDVLGLEAKLRSGQFNNIVEYALAAKEIFHKQLYKNQFYESAQKINCFLLSLVQSYFNTYVYPQICDGMKGSEVIILVQERIVDPLLSQLGENVLDLMADDIQGMVYFLTGNCHIKWSV